MRASRKPRVVWFPQTNANSVGISPRDISVFQNFTVDVNGLAGDFAVGEIPLVIDGEGDPLAAANTLSDIENSGYRLRRVVGKIWVSIGTSDEDTPVEVVVTAGIIVRRTNEQTGASYALETANGELLSPGQIRNAGDPWVWRRSWRLGNNRATTASPDFPFLAETNEFFSALDGPHVDQKTARIIGPEERLFLDVSSTIIVAGGNPALTLSAFVLTDLRVLGSMRTSSGNRRNASR